MIKDFAFKFNLPFMKWINVYRVFKPYARRHGGSFFFGCLAALGVVMTRLALPWPIHEMVHSSLGHLSREAGSAQASFVLDLSHRTLFGGVLFFLLFAAHGLMDFLERFYFARFAIGLVRDIRAEAFKACAAMDPAARSKQSGELVARLIGDTARIKAGLKGFLIHTMTNGITFAGICIVLLILDLRIGLIFVSAGLISAVISVLSASSTYRKAMKHRKKEGRLADAIEQVWRKKPSESKFAEVNYSSGRHEAALTRIQGWSTLWAHVAFGAAIVLSLWIGTRAIEQGRLEPGHLLVVVVYAFLMRGSMVHLARQGSRSGSMVACATRLKQIMDETRTVTEGDPLEPLKNCLVLAGIRVKNKKGNGERKRLGPLDLKIFAGQKIAILGDAGSGKTTLLDLVMGHLQPQTGEMLWDGRNLAQFPVQSRWRHIFYLPQVPSWRRQRFQELLNLPGMPSDKDTLNLMRLCEVDQVLDRQAKGLATKMSSQDLSFGECKRLGLARVFFSKAWVYLLDDPVGFVGKKHAREMIQAILEMKKNSTVLAVLSRPVAIERFDRVIELRRGRIIYDGTPSGTPDSKAAKADMAI